MTSAAPGATEHHYSHRAGWLRASVLGANDGIVSTASLVLGVAGAGGGGGAVLTAGVAGVVAGALSMAAGEFVSVSSQRDTEEADLAMEATELLRDPGGELTELAAIYEQRGLDATLARQVAEALSARDALAAHARDELGLEEVRRARPLQAAWSSAAAFTAGGVLPLVATALPDPTARVVAVVLVAVAALAVLGATGARLGGAPVRPATVRVVAWGLVAMAVTYGVGAAIGTAL